MKLLNLSGRQFSGSGGNEKQLTMIVEGHGMGFRTRVRLSSTPWVEGLEILYFQGFPAFPVY